jgi:hypothetical protein
MRLTKISGLVDRLTLSSEYENLGDGATAGLAFSAAALAGATDSIEVDVEFFACTVNGIPIVGKFHSVGFKEGDNMEFVLSEHDGIAISYGARCEKKRMLWMPPHHIRGHQAQSRYDIKVTLLSSLSLTVLGTIFLVFVSSLLALIEI